ncbi:MAG: hypothetical protein MJ237_08825 [bacterium]|nr:hypothetical protein [bacterium]
MLEDTDLYILNDKETQNRINKIAKKYRNKKILLYGAGLYASRFLKEYDLSALNIIGISDKIYEINKPEVFFGYKTYSPSEIPTLDFDVMLLSVIKYYNLANILKKTILKGINRHIILDSLTKKYLMNRILTIIEE